MAQSMVPPLHNPAGAAQLESLCTQVRRDILRMVHGAQSGHPGGSMGCVEYFVALYFRVMHHTPLPFSMAGHGEDLFFLSNGHISPVWYSVLARAGYFPVSELATFRKLNSRLQGHPATHEGLPGVRVATGSLGQGVSVAVGAAQAKKLNNDTRQVWCLMGDGEAQEGQIWEAAIYAAHHKVDNLIVTIDLNYKQIDGDTRDVMDTRDLGAKFRAFNWEVVQLPNGNVLANVIATMQYARTLAGNGKPVAILMSTMMGRGVDFMEDDHNWHGAPPSDEQLELAIGQLALEAASDY